MTFNHESLVAATRSLGGSEPAIEAHDLVKSYGQVLALDGVGFTVPVGAVFGLLGPNGAGKSTTVKILTSLSIPDRGNATVAGHDVLRSPDEVRRSIGVVAQKAGADPIATGRENMMLQGRLYGMHGGPLRCRVNELLERFDLESAADRQARTYSGGMLRRLDVAMGLVHRPQVLFLDEPTNGLDPEVRALMWAEIARLAREEALTVLLTTHYLEEADRLADRLAIVDRGKIVAEGSPDQLKGELHGDAVQVEVADRDATSRAHAILDGMHGIGQVVVNGRELRARVDDGGTAVPVVLNALDAAGVPVSSVTVSRPSLDDVYLRHAGRAFRVDEGVSA